MHGRQRLHDEIIRRVPDFSPGVGFNSKRPGMDLPPAPSRFANHKGKYMGIWRYDTEASAIRFRDINTDNLLFLFLRLSSS